jgi:hypothetical protein
MAGVALALVALLLAACGSVNPRGADAARTSDVRDSAAAGDSAPPADAPAAPADQAEEADAAAPDVAMVPDTARDTATDGLDAPKPDAGAPDNLPPDAPAVNDGTSPERAAESCLAILVKTATKVDGRYWIRPDPLGPPLQVFCDMTQDEGGWTLVFKLSDGLAGDAATLRNGTGPLNEGRAELLTRDKAALNYRNSIVTDAWNSTFIVRRVRINFFIAGQSRAFVIFAGNQTTPTSWFDKPNLLSSSWTDLTPAAATNYFSIDGDPVYVRRFFANINYGGCQVDRGWFGVSSGTFCPWDDPTMNMAILYSTQKTSVLWQAPLAPARADVLAVFVR